MAADRLVGKSEASMPTRPATGGEQHRSEGSWRGLRRGCDSSVNGRGAGLPNVTRSSVGVSIVASSQSVRPSQA